MTRGNDRHNRKKNDRRRPPRSGDDRGYGASSEPDQVPWWERRYGGSEQEYGTGHDTAEQTGHNTGQNTAYGSRGSDRGSESYGGTREFDVAAFRESAGTGYAREGGVRGRSSGPPPPPRSAPPERPSPPPDREPPDRMPPDRDFSDRVPPDRVPPDRGRSDPRRRPPPPDVPDATTITPSVPAPPESEPLRDTDPALEPADPESSHATHHHAAAKKPPVLQGPRWLPTGLDFQILTWWVLTRVSLLMVSVSGPALFAPAKGEPGFLQRWMSWDFAHFNRIAQFGYFDPEWKTPTEAFFPGLPLLMKIGAPFGDNGTVVVGLLISFVAGGVAAVALGRLAESEFGTGAGMKAAIAWMVAPPAVFLAAPYTESLFLGLAVPAWLAARRGHWWLAGIFAMGACSIRVSGVFLIVALIVEFATSKRRGNIVNGAWLALPALPLLAYMAYLWSKTGDPFRWYNAQSQGWFRGFTMPWDSLLNSIKGATGTLFESQDPATLANWAWMFRMELIAMLIGVVLTVVLLTLRRWGEMTWVGLQVAAFSTSQFFFSVPRATLLWFPLWMGIGAIMANRPRLWQLYLVIVLPLFGIWATAFFLYKWAG